MKTNDLLSYLADSFPYRRKSSLEWIVPASAGIGLGIAFGVGLGILIAPTSGEQTRRRLRESAERVKERAAGAAQRAQEQARELAGSVAGEQRSFAADLGAR